MTVGGENHRVTPLGESNVRTGQGEIKLQQVLYVPSLKKNLISIEKFDIYYSIFKGSMFHTW